MGTLHKEIWTSSGSGQTRSQRKSGAYFYYLPTPLAALNLSLDPIVAGDVSRAEQAMIALNRSASALHSSEGIARLLLRAEAVSSSFIEGLTIGTRRLLRAELNLAEKGTFRFDEKAVDIVGNVHAMERAIEAACSEMEITMETILNIHEALCENTQLAQHGGKIRERQNWVGGNSYNPFDAEYIPPAREHLQSLLEDLAVFCNRTDISPVVQAALVHAQFLTIHPFIDGNGRTGRALIHLILQRRGITPNLVPPISLVMATHSKSYVTALTDFRLVEEAAIKVNTSEESAGINKWIAFFAFACIAACEEALEFEESARALEVEWRQQLGKVRKNSALDLLIKELVGMPIFTIKSAGMVIGRSVNATTAAIDACVEAGIIKRVGNQRRNKVFEVPEAIEYFNLFERRLASPLSDTRIAKPNRPVPSKL